MSRWDSLLSLQEHDTAADQLRHRRAHLPQRAELDAVMQELAQLEAADAAVTEQRHELGRRQQRIEDEISSLTDRATQHDKTLYGGTIGNPRELQLLQDEIGALKRRISQLEDQELELMEEIEPFDKQLAQTEELRAALDKRCIELRTQLTEAEVAVDAELARVTAERDSLVGTIDPDLVSDYEELRPRSAGIAIAPLVGRSCGGCHLGLSAVEIDRIKKLPTDAPAHCEECGRLLAR